MLKREIIIEQRERKRAHRYRLDGKGRREGMEKCHIEFRPSDGSSEGNVTTTVPEASSPGAEVEGWESRAQPVLVEEHQRRLLALDRIVVPPGIPRSEAGWARRADEPRL